MMATRFICRNTILALSVHLLLIISAEANRQKNIKIQIEGLLGAFGDFDSDKYTDLFVIHSNLSSFEIRKASADNPYNFQSQPELACSTAPDQTIVGLIPADYHGEAMLDVVVLTKSKSNTESDSFRLFLIEGNRTALNCSNLTFDQHFAVSRIQPLLLGDYQCLTCYHSKIIFRITFLI